MIEGAFGTNGKFRVAIPGIYIYSVHVMYAVIKFITTYITCTHYGDLSNNNMTIYYRWSRS